MLYVLQTIPVSNISFAYQDVRNDDQFDKLNNPAVLYEIQF